MIKNNHDEVSYTYYPKNEFDEVIRETCNTWSFNLGPYLHNYCQVSVEINNVEKYRCL